MSGSSLTPTVAATPTAVQAATDLLALMAGLTGTVTDYNPGSQVRTLAESIGAMIETEGVGAQALVLQGMVYGALSLFGITASSGAAATGIVTFATAFPVSGAPPIAQSVAIPSGTLVQTSGGITFATTVAAVLTSGAVSVNVGVIATATGAVGNVPTSGIAGYPLTSIGYPLQVSNPIATAGGAAAASLSQVLAQFTARAASLGLSSPVAVANASIGVTATGTGEVVQYAAVYEPWIAAGSGAGSGTAGFTLYVDNGTGTASTSLLAAVSAWITGSQPANQSGYRPAGVPFTVASGTPVYAVVNATGILQPGFLTPAAVISGATSVVQSYFAGLGFGAGAQQAQIAADIANAGLGTYESLTVSLFYSGASGAVNSVTGAYNNRVILSAINLNITLGT
jgi:hypothetical protein